MVSIFSRPRAYSTMKFAVKRTLSEGDVRILCVNWEGREGVERNGFQIWPRRGDFEVVKGKAEGLSWVKEEKREGVLTPRVVQPTQTTGGHPYAARSSNEPRNVSRAMREINRFDWEGDFKPMARQALKDLLEKR